MFKSRNINLRKLKIEDHIIYNKLKNDSEVSYFTGLVIDRHSLQDSYSFVEMMIKQKMQKAISSKMSKMGPQLELFPL